MTGTIIRGGYVGGDVDVTIENDIVIIGSTAHVRDDVTITGDRIISNVADWVVVLD